MQHNFEIKPYTQEDYTLLLSWWKQYEWKGIPQHFLSNRGFIVHVNQQPCVAGFVYVTSDAPMALIDFIIGDKDFDARQKLVATNKLIDHLVHVAKEQTGDDGFVYTVTKHSGLQKMYKRKGFKVGEEDTTSMFLPFSEFDEDFLTEE